MYDPNRVRNWIAKAEAEVEDLSREAERLQARLAEARRNLMLLYEILATVTNAPVPVAQDELERRPIRERVQAGAESILREHGKPMSLQQIHAEFIRRELPLPGRGSPTNILAHLSASDRFSRKGRGVYGLAEWDRSSHPARPAPPEASSDQEATHAARAEAHQRRQARGS